MMNELGNKIAGKRKDLGITQADFADRLCVTRQTVSRWENGSVMPDIDKIGDIASLLGVSCDYLLKDEIREEPRVLAAGEQAADEQEEAEDSGKGVSGVSRLLLAAKGKKVRLTFFEDDADIDLFNADCTIVDFEGNWMKVATDTKKGHIEKLIAASSVLSVEFVKEDN